MGDEGGMPLSLARALAHILGTLVVLVVMAFTGFSGAPASFEARSGFEAAPIVAAHAPEAVVQSSEPLSLGETEDLPVTETAAQTVESRPSGAFHRVAAPPNDPAFASLTFGFDRPPSLRVPGRNGSSILV